MGVGSLVLGCYLARLVPHVRRVLLRFLLKFATTTGVAMGIATGTAASASAAIVPDGRIV